MNKQIEELVEQVANLYCLKVHHCKLSYLGYDREKDIVWQHPDINDSLNFAKQILTCNPNLALILDPQYIDWQTEPEKVRDSSLALVIPLSEALKEVEK